MRSALVCTLALLLSSCNQGGARSPVAPTPVAATPQAPPPPPPQPTITNYGGRWSGSYIVFECSGSSGSMGDVLCSAPRPGNSGGIFYGGPAYPFSLELSQNGSNVSGIIGIGQTRGNVSGSVRSDQSLFLSGSATASSDSVIVTLNLTSWNTSLIGGTLEGTIGFGVRVNVFPGDGVVRARLSNVRR